MKEAYRSTAQELVRRIRVLAAKDPGVLTLISPWDLFKHGLKCDDLGPSLGQATVALSEAKRLGPLEP